MTLEEMIAEALLDVEETARVRRSATYGRERALRDFRHVEDQDYTRVKAARSGQQLNTVKAEVNAIKAMAHDLTDGWSDAPCTTVEDMPGDGCIYMVAGECRCMWVDHDPMLRIHGCGSHA